MLFTIFVLLFAFLLTCLRLSLQWRCKQGDTTRRSKKRRRNDGEKMTKIARKNGKNCALKSSFQFQYMVWSDDEKERTKRTARVQFGAVQSH
jgi:hypothetical protein